MQPWEHSRLGRLAGPIGLTALTVAGVLLLSSMGLADQVPASLGPFSVIVMLVTGGGVALAYLLGAFGFGRPLAAMLAPSSQSRLWLQLALGLATMLWISHAMGVAGWLSGAGIGPRIAGWAPIAIGLALLGDQVVRGQLRPERWPVLPASAMLWAPGLAVLIVASANPTGTLWGGREGTEFNGFDALSYHLQLPKEWAAGTRLWPCEHNVYSFLPSFIEGAFLHLGAMGPGGEKCNEPMTRMLGGPGDDSNWVIACQYLHAGIAIIGAMLAARCASVLVRRVKMSGGGAPGGALPPHAERGGTQDRSATTIGVIVGALTLCTPWMIVVASLPYNDAAVVTLAAAGILGALDDRVPVARRAIIAGWIVGVACGCKPTALFMTGPLVGLVLLGGVSCRRWWIAGIGGSVVGALALAPWLWRNWAASGNPVFPFGAKWFGMGHWTAEQVERYARNHAAPPGMGLGDRIGRLFSVEFGMMHPQWGMLLAATIAGAVFAFAWQPVRRMAGLLVGGLAVQLACWVLLTHMQSRFLLPVITPSVLLIALGAGGFVAWLSRSGEARTRTFRVCAMVVLALVPLDHARRSIGAFLVQNGGYPNIALVRGVGGLTGLAIDEDLSRLDEAEREAILLAIGPLEYINLALRPQERPDSGVYLLGDSAPLYLLSATGRPALPGGATSDGVYNTTWDTPLLAQLIRSAPGEPAAWSRGLRSRGIRYVLVNFSELHRLIEQSGYYDPAVTMADVVRWVMSPDSRLKPVRAWQPAAAPPMTGVELYEIDLPPATDSPRRPSLEDHIR